MLHGRGPGAAPDFRNLLPLEPRTHAAFFFLPPPVCRRQRCLKLREGSPAAALCRPVMRSLSPWNPPSLSDAGADACSRAAGQLFTYITAQSTM